MNVGSCHCGGNADACAEAEQHTGPVPSEPGPSIWTFGACATCRRERSVATESRVCAPCSTTKLRNYFASDEAAEITAQIMGTPMPARRKAAA